MATYAVEGGKVDAIDIGGRVLAHGSGSNAILVSNSGSTPLTKVRAKASTGETLVIKDVTVTDRTLCLISQPESSE